MDSMNNPLPAGVTTEQAREALTDTRSAVRTVFLNPLSAMQMLFEMFGTSRALGVGLVLVGCFAFSLGIVLYQTLQSSLGPFAQTGLGPFLKLLVGGAVPAISLWLACMLVRLVCRSFHGPTSDIFLVGIALTPLTAFFLASLLVGLANYTVLAVLGVFALCYFILLQFSGLTRLAGMSESRAAFVLPIVLLASAMIAKIVLTHLLGM